MCDFLIARASALARSGRGERSVELRETLSALAGQAAAAEMNVAQRALVVALGHFPATDRGA